MILHYRIAAMAMAVINLLFLSHAFAGNTSCTTIASGSWSDTNTWSCTTGSGIPESDTAAVIHDTHTVTLDVDASLTELVVNSDGNNIAESVSEIVGANADHVVTLDNANFSAIDGFTVTAGDANGVAEDSNGGGLHCVDPGMVRSHVLNQMIFVGNRATVNGGAIGDCRLVVDNSSFLANEAGGSGGAIHTPQVSLETVDFARNKASQDGGAVYHSGELSQIRHVAFLANEAGGEGELWMEAISGCLRGERG